MRRVAEMGARLGTGFRRAAPWSLIVALLLVASAACGDDDEDVATTPAPAQPAATQAAADAEREPEGTLTVIAGFGSERFLLRTATGEAALSVIAEPLVWWDWATDTPTNGAILESFENTENADGSVDWVFKIKPGIKFHKGYGEVTAEDVKFTMTEFLKEGSVNANTSIITTFFGKDPDNIVVVDDLTLTIHQPQPMNPIEVFRVMSPDDGGRTLRPFSKAYFEEVGEDEFARNPVYAGPYEFVSQVPGVSMTVRAVEDHYRVTPGYEEIVYLNVQDDSTRVAMLRTGEVDIAQVPARLVSELEAAGIRIAIAQNAVEPFIAFGGLYPTRPNYDPSLPWAGEDPMSERSLQVRRALSLAVDRQAIVDKILFGYGEPGVLSFSFIRPGMPWWNDEWTPDPYDPEQARQLMTDAGYPDCFDIKIWLINGQVYGPDIGEAVAQMWEANLGCNVIRNQADYRPGLRSMLFDRTTGDEGGWTWSFEGGPIVRPTRYACLHGGPTFATLTHTELPYFDVLCEQLNKETDIERQIQLERELGNEIYRSYPTIPIASLHLTQGVGPNVGSWEQVSPRRGPLSYLEFVYPE